MGGDRGVFAIHPPIIMCLKPNDSVVYGMIRVNASGLWGDKALIQGGGGGLYTLRYKPPTPY